MYTEREAAEKAREAIIKELEAGAKEEDALNLAHTLAGMFEEQIRIKAYELQDGFDGDAGDLFEDVPEG